MKSYPQMKKDKQIIKFLKILLQECKIIKKKNKILVKKIY